MLFYANALYDFLKISQVLFCVPQGKFLEVLVIKINVLIWLASMHIYPGSPAGPCAVHLMADLPVACVVRQTLQHWDPNLNKTKKKEVVIIYCSLQGSSDDSRP